MCNLHISVLNGALWDMEKVYNVFFQLGQMIYGALNKIGDF